jgi:hypothetical protein
MAARRVRLPAADDLFRPTAPADDAPATTPATTPATSAAASGSAAEPGPAAPKRPSGRIRHDEKMTVYVTSEELLDIEHARLTLRREFGLALDRGKLVRHAVAIALADLEANGATSALLKRLSED